MIKKYIRVNDEEAAIGYDYYLAKHGEGILDLPDRRGLVFVIEETAKPTLKPQVRPPKRLNYWNRPFLMTSRKAALSIE